MILVNAFRCLGWTKWVAATDWTKTLLQCNLFSNLWDCPFLPCRFKIWEMYLQVSSSSVTRHAVTWWQISRRYQKYPTYPTCDNTSFWIWIAYTSVHFRDDQTLVFWGAFTPITVTRFLFIHLWILWILHKMTAETCDTFVTGDVWHILTQRWGHAHHFMGFDRLATELVPRCRPLRDQLKYLGTLG